MNELAEEINKRKHNLISELRENREDMEWSELVEYGRWIGQFDIALDVVQRLHWEDSSKISER